MLAVAVAVAVAMAGDRKREIVINAVIIEYDKFKFYQDQIPLHAGAEALA